MTGRVSDLTDETEDAKIIPMPIHIPKPTREIVRIDNAKNVMAVWGAKSESDPGLVHITILWRDVITGKTSTTCTCKAAAYQGSCWHLEAINESI